MKDLKEIHLYLEKYGTISIKKLIDLGYASAWTSYQLKRGYLSKVSRGVYSLGEQKHTNKIDRLTSVIYSVTESNKVMKAADLKVLGITPIYTKKLLDRLVLRKISRGYYQINENISAKEKIKK